MENNVRRIKPIGIAAVIGPRGANYFWTLMMLLVVLVLLLASCVFKRKKIAKLGKEKKDIYNMAVEKIKKIDLINKMLVGIGILTFIIVSIIKVEFFPTKFLDHFGIAIYSPMQEVFGVVAPRYIVIYYIVLILFNNFYVKKRIEKYEELSENEKVLLKKYYINPTYLYVWSAVILEGLAIFLSLFFG